MNQVVAEIQLRKGKKLQIVQGDLTLEAVDAIVTQAEVKAAEAEAEAAEQRRRQREQERIEAATQPEEETAQSPGEEEGTEQEDAKSGDGGAAPAAVIPQEQEAPAEPDGASVEAPTEVADQGAAGIQSD